MSLLSDEEIDALWLPDGITKPQMIVRRAVVRAAEKAILAKLAAKELPEPIQRDDTEHGVGYFTATQLHEAHAQGFAAGAASQLSVEPVAQGDPVPLYRAAINCPHEIDHEQVILKYDPKQPGHNALNQLGRRLVAAVAAPKAPEPLERVAECAAAIESLKGKQA